MSRTAHRRYRRNRDRALRNSDVCALCGQPIDPNLRYPHPMSASAHHIEAFAITGDNFSELAATHLRCNQRAGTKGRLSDEPGDRHAITW